MSTENVTSMFGNLSTYDYIVIACIVGLGILGLCNGLMKELFSMLSVFVSIIGAKFACGPIATWAYSKYNIYDMLVEKITEAVESTSGAAADGAKQILLDATAKIPLIGSTIGKYVTDNIDFMGLTNTSAIREDVTLYLVGKAVPIAQTFLTIAGFAVAFILIRIVMAIVMKCMDRTIALTSITNSMDKIFGLLFGVVKGIVISVILIFILFTLFTYINSKHLPGLVESNVFQFISQMQLFDFLNLKLMV